MKKLSIFLLFMLAGFLTVNAQSFLASTAKPKYLPENKAADLIALKVEKQNSQATIDIQSIQDVQHFTFYILKGVSYNNGEMRWQIIASYDNPSQKTFNKKIVDSNDGINTVMYRVMVINRDQQIEYTPIVSLENNSRASVNLGLALN